MSNSNSSSNSNRNSYLKWGISRAIADEVYSLWKHGLIAQECDALDTCGEHIFQKVGRWTLSEGEDVPGGWSEDYISKIFHTMGDIETVFTKGATRHWHNPNDPNWARSTRDSTKQVELPSLYHFQSVVSLLKVCELYAMMLTGEYDFLETYDDLPDAHYVESIDAYIIGDGNHRLFARRLFANADVLQSLLSESRDIVALLYSFKNPGHIMASVKDQKQELIEAHKSNANRNNAAHIEAWINSDLDDAMAWWLANQR